MYLLLLMLSYELSDYLGQYVERMRQDGVWGGNQEIFAASQYFDADILIHQVRRWGEVRIVLKRSALIRALAFPC